MPTHAEKRTLPYSAAQLCALVADVDKYPEFLPWCLASRINKREEATEDGEVFYADLIIGYKMVREKFGSKVTVVPGEHVHVEYLSGPMSHLSNHWWFIDGSDRSKTSCTIDFYVEFEFKNRVFQSLMGSFYSKIVRRMVAAFEERARDLYGDPDEN